jgi:hypothetical protein
LTEAKKVRKVNRDGQRWTRDQARMTLRLPLELREAITEEARVKGDLARIILFALSHEIQRIRKAGRWVYRFALLSCCTLEPEARATLREWAEEEGERGRRTRRNVTTREVKGIRSERKAQSCNVDAGRANGCVERHSSSLVKNEPG